MTDRTLKDVTYIEAIPVTGKCGYCGQSFITSASAMDNPETATQNFYAAFISHKCGEGTTVFESVVHN